MRHLVLIKHPETFDIDDIPPALFGAVDEFVQEGFKSGTIIDTAGLQPTKAGTRIRLSKGKLMMTDGPFTEAKEVVGGYVLIETKTRDEALAYARKFMELHKEHWPGFEGECEIRPLEANP